MFCGLLTLSLVQDGQMFLFPYAQYSLVLSFFLLLLFLSYVLLGVVNAHRYNFYILESCKTLSLMPTFSFHFNNNFLCVLHTHFFSFCTLCAWQIFFLYTSLCKRYIFYECPLKKKRNWKDFLFFSEPPVTFDMILLVMLAAAAARSLKCMVY